MKPDRQAKRYARSLFTVAKQCDAAGPVAESLSGLAMLMKKEPLFREFIITRRITDAEKYSVIRSVLADQIHPVVIEFMVIVIENKAHGHVVTTERIYRRLMAKETAVENLTIYSADTLPEAESKAIVARLEKKSGKTLRWKSITDPSLIGGLKLRIGNLFLDGSIASRLNSLKKSLLSQ